MKFPETLPIPEEVLAIARTLEDAGHEAWCVGGAIRDALLQSLESDVDVATSAPPAEVQRLFPRTVAVGLKYGTVGVLDRRRHLHEVTTFRRDVKTDGRHAEVEFGVSLEEDLARRDFTINAIAYHPLRHEWRDPFGGAADLGRRRIRAVGEPAARFREDYLRILRALRFAARLDFLIDDATWAAAVAATPGLVDLSAERVREEWFKGLRTTRSLARLVGLWWRVGAAHYWLPELTDRPEPEVSQTQATSRMGAVPRRSLGTTIRALDRLSPAERDPVELTVLLCLDPVAVLQRLRASNAEIARAAAMVTGPDEPAGLDEVATRRWLAAVGDAADDLARLWELRRDQPWHWAATVARIRQRGDPLRRSDLVVTGADLIAEGVPAGPTVGRLLEQLLDAVLDDPSINTRPALLARVREALCSP